LKRMADDTRSSAPRVATGRAEVRSVPREFKCRVARRPQAARRGACNVVSAFHQPNVSIAAATGRPDLLNIFIFYIFRVIKAPGRFLGLC
jgi:hypothetical protein